MFFEAFHEIQWYGLFLVVVLFFLQSLFAIQKKFVMIALIFLIALFGYTVFSPKSYIFDKVNRQIEFVTNYGNYLANGEVIRLLADKNDTLFADDIDDLLYVQAGVKPAYKYSWYFGVMPTVLKYRKEKEAMFAKSPPTFYFSFCSEKTHASDSLSSANSQKYQQLYFAGRKTCLYVLKTKIATITPDKWEKIKQYEYYLPTQ
jgi:hypothetical protein